MSVAIDARVEVRAGVALVAVRVHNPTPVARRVRVANRLPGPVLPPRRHGVPEAGWDGDGVTAVVDAEGATALGYACPLGDRDPVDPPAALESVGDPDAGVDEADADPVARARRDLGPHRPPRDAVALGARGETPRDASETNCPAPVPQGSTAPTVEDRLERVGERVVLAELLTGASVAEATAALAASDLPPAALADAVADDVETLRSLARRTPEGDGRAGEHDARAGELAARAEATDVPVDALRRLA